MDPQGKITEVAEQIVAEIIHDMLERGGFDDLWDNLHEGVRVEIRQQWVKLTRKTLKQLPIGLDNGD